MTRLLEKRKGCWATSYYKVLTDECSLAYWPFVLCHRLVDGNGWEVLFHEQLRQSHASCDWLHKDDHLHRTDIHKVDNPLNTHTRVTAPFPGLPGWAGTRKVKSIWILLKQETVSGSGISWAICKSAPRSRQMTTPAPTLSFFTRRMPFLPPNQQCQSTEG